ncbi:MAG: hypothetical protein IMZ75_17580 [Actinobacteria bacterium]|nr:hypothetical protein [Actinomycetota bacterium]
MTEQTPSPIGTVAQEAARLIEDMATMARSSFSRGDDPSPYADGPAQEPAQPDAPYAARPAEDPEAADKPSAGACSLCGGERDDTPATCRLCPLCRGIALLRSVRPETVDLLADLALAMAASLRDVATRSRATDPESPDRSPSGSRPDGDRATVQDIPVDDEGEG